MADEKPTCNKTKYASRKDADDDIKRISKKSTRQFVPQRSYWCRICYHWHITSQPENNAMFNTIKELEKEVSALKEELAKAKAENNKKAGITQHERTVYESKIHKMEDIFDENKMLRTLLRKKKDIIKKLNTRISKLVTENFMLNKWKQKPSSNNQTEKS